MQTSCKTCGKSLEGLKGLKFCSNSCRWRDPDNAEKRKSNNLKRRKRQLKFIRRVKTFYGCQLCGYRLHFAALQFDHINPEEKSFELSKGHTRSMSQIKEEMRKCRVLCSNCHAIHTHNQREEKNVK